MSIVIQLIMKSVGVEKREQIRLSSTPFSICDCRACYQAGAYIVQKRSPNSEEVLSYF